jgi:formylglycine-generating enzyme
MNPLDRPQEEPIEIDRTSISEPFTPIKDEDLIDRAQSSSKEDIPTIQPKSVEEIQELSVSPPPTAPLPKMKRVLRRGPRVTLTSQKTSNSGIKAPRGLKKLPPAPSDPADYFSPQNKTLKSKKTARPQPHVFEVESVKESIEDVVQSLEESQAQPTKELLSLIPQVSLNEDLLGTPQHLDPQFAPYQDNKYEDASHNQNNLSTEDFINQLAIQRNQTVTEVEQNQANAQPLEMTIHHTESFQKQQGDVALHKDMRLAGHCTLKYLINKIQGIEAWLAHHDDYGLVVLKLVWPTMLSENAMMWQFDAEMQLLTLQNIQHDIVQRVYDWGEEETCGAWYVMLAWVEGESLADQLKRGPLSYDKAYHYFEILAQGLIQCHQQGIIHRKIQPSHIILQDEYPYLISFQWVEEIGGEDLQRKQQGVYQKLGTRPKYLAPEWIQDSRITSVADIYALAACFLSAVNPNANSWRDAPLTLQSTMSAALHHDPNSRSSAQEFFDDLSQSNWKYEYQNSQEDHFQTLMLHELVQRIRKDELGWHLIRRLGTNQEECQPWGSHEEVVKAVKRAQRYQPETDLHTQQFMQDTQSIEAREAAVNQKLKELQAQQQQLQNRIRDVKKQEDEANWKEEALRVRENELLQKDAGLQEENQRLQQKREALEQQEQILDQKESDLIYKEKIVLEQLAESESVKAETLKLMAETRVLQTDIEQKHNQQQQALALTESELSAQRALRVRMETTEYQAKVEVAAQELLQQREHQALLEIEKEKEQARADFLAQQAQATEIEAKNQSYRAGQAQETRKRMLANLQEGLPFRASIKSAPTPIIEKPLEASVSEIFVGNYCWRLRYCPAGMTWLGSKQGEGKSEEKPCHKIRINKGFWFAETPVTQALWNQIMEDNPSQFLGQDRPVEGVTWLEAVLFCNALSLAQNLEPAYEVLKENHRTEVQWYQNASGYRLPTEAEWEYAARCGQSGQSHLYTNGSDLDAVAWFSKNAKGETQSVGLKEANSWGLYDLCGNVWEWCHDTWKKDIYRTRSDGVTRDPFHYQALLTPRSVRGGAWYDFAACCRLAYRPGLDVNGPYGVGLRPCLPHA